METNAQDPDGLFLEDFRDTTVAHINPSLENNNPPQSSRDLSLDAASYSLCWQTAGTNYSLPTMTTNAVEDIPPHYDPTQTHYDESMALYPTLQSAYFNPYANLADVSSQFPQNYSYPLAPLPVHHEDNSIPSAFEFNPSPQFLSTPALGATYEQGFPLDASLTTADDTSQPWRFPNFQQHSPWPDMMQNDPMFLPPQVTTQDCPETANSGVALLPDLESRLIQGGMASCSTLSTRSCGHSDYANHANALPQDFSSAGETGPFGFALDFEAIHWPAMVDSESCFNQQEGLSIEGHPTEPLQSDSTLTLGEGSLFINPAIPTEAETNPEEREVRKSFATDISRRPAFGPKGPVSLKPKPKGGRKGPLTMVEKATQKEARQRGVCIRCRRFGKPCLGGFPCKACLEKSKATFWKFPCVKANFFDMIEIQPYFESIAKFWSGDLDKLDEKLIIRQLQKVVLAALKEQGREVSTGLQPPFDTQGLVVWDIAIKTFLEILTTNEDARKPSSISDRMSLVAQRRAKKAHALPPIMFSTPLPHGGCRMTWRARNLVFCLSPCTYKGKETGYPEESATLDSLNGALETLTWISRRQFELSLFQHLQNTSNKLSDLPKKDLLDTARLLLQILMIGAPDNLRLVRRSSCLGTNRFINSTYLEQKGEIRSALICYFRISLALLPSWNYFFQELDIVERLVAKHVLQEDSSLDVFQTKAENEFELSYQRFDRWAQWETKLDSVRRATQSDSDQDDLKLELSYIMEFPSNALQESTYRSDVEYLVETITEEYRPRLKLVVDASETMEELATDEHWSFSMAEFKGLADLLETFQHSLPRVLKEFEDRSNLEEKNEIFQRMLSTVVVVQHLLDSLDEVFKGIAIFGQILLARFDSSQEKEQNSVNGNGSNST